MTKKTKRTIPEGVARVRNMATGEEKLWCAMCGKWGDHRSGGCLQLKSETIQCLDCWLKSGFKNKDDGAHTCRTGICENCGKPHVILWKERHFVKSQ